MKKFRNEIEIKKFENISSYYNTNKNLILKDKFNSYVYLRI